MNTQLKVLSASVNVGASDKNCKHWSKIVRANVDLPLPVDVSGAKDIPSRYIEDGEEELFPGDVLFEGEAVHAYKDRGWVYRIAVCGENGKPFWIQNPGTEFKAEMKAAGCNTALLPGSGMLAACIRIAHGLRAGLLKTPGAVAVAPKDTPAAHVITAQPVAEAQVQDGAMSF